MNKSCVQNDLFQTPSRSGMQLLQTKVHRSRMEHNRTGGHASTGKFMYHLHKDRQCDVHHLHAHPVLVSREEAEAHCDKDPLCSGLYDNGCNGVGFLVCTEDFTLISASGSQRRRRGEQSRFQGCVYTKPNWAPVKWTKTSTGCKCYFDENRMDCACCAPGGCQCSQPATNRCVPCDAMYKCVVKQDLSDFPDLLTKVSPGLYAELNEVLEAQTYEGRQTGIRGFLRKAYELPTSAAKLQAVALLDAKLNRERSTDLAFEFPKADEVEDWLTSWFLEDEIWKTLTHKRNGQSSGNRRRRGSKMRLMQKEKKLDQEPPIIKGLVSRGALLQKSMTKCNWKIALQAFYATGGAYGNWCGKSPPGIKNRLMSYGACTGAKVRRGRFGLDVCADQGFDESCSRHDQGAYSVNIFGVATKSLCKVDADFQIARKRILQALQNLNHTSAFKDETSRNELDSLKAADCLFDMMPCLRYERSVYWDWCESWSGGYPCKKTKVGYSTHWPMGDYNKFKDDACGPPGCYSEVKDGAETPLFGSSFGTSISDLRAEHDHQQNHY